MIGRGGDREGGRVYFPHTLSDIVAPGLFIVAPGSFSTPYHVTKYTCILTLYTD